MIKQHITKKQLGELSYKQQQKYILTIPDSTLVAYVDGIHCLITIGQMIEYLGDDLGGMEWDNHNWTVSDIYHKVGDDYKSKELVDALWEAVKYKQKNI